MRGRSRPILKPDDKIELDATRVPRELGMCLYRVESEAKESGGGICTGGGWMGCARRDADDGIARSRVHASRFTDRGQVKKVWRMGFECGRVEKLYEPRCSYGVQSMEKLVRTLPIEYRS